MNRCYLRSALRLALPTAAATASAAILAACSSSLDLTQANLGAPSVVVTAAAKTCTAPAGGATVTLDDIGTKITTGHPTSVPVNRVDVVGTATGLPASNVVVVVVIPSETACPVSAAITAAVGADGRFTATLPIADGVHVLRVQALSTAEPSEVGCGTATDCISTGSVAPSGVSGALLLHLP